MKSIALRHGALVPALGLGTWRMGESTRMKSAEVASLRCALELGYRLIDTAEMYGEGGAEEIIGEALAEAFRAGVVARDDLFIVSKVSPHNGRRAGVLAACERSRQRLQIDAIDLYLLHWPGPHPIEETVDAFEHLVEGGRIGRWGVSNFDTDALEAMWRFEAGRHCATNQIYYSLSERGPQVALLPWQRQRQMPTMAYSPIDQGQLAANEALRVIAARMGATPAQVALAWLLSADDVMAIPKAIGESHLRENMAAADLVLDASVLSELDRQFPPPRSRTPLSMR